MKFLKEANNNSGLLSIKDDLEKSTGSKYQELQGTQRDDFIKEVLDKSPKFRILSSAISEIVNIIKESNWNQSFINYLDGLPNNVDQIPGIALELVNNLLNTNKIDLDNSKDWLYNPSLYSRGKEDLLYTLKALTFASNENLQKTSKGENKYFSSENPLTVKDLIDENGNIYNADRIQDVINEKQVKKVDFTDPSFKKDIKTILKSIAKQNGVDSTELDGVINKKDEIIKKELADTLLQLGIRNPGPIVNASFETGKTTEYLLQKILKDRGNL